MARRHLVEQRAEMINSLEGSFRQHASELFKKNKGIQDNIIYLGLDTYKKDRNAVSTALNKGYKKVDDEKLDSILEMPEMSFPYFDMITFTLYREASIVGQIALWRRLLNYAPMNYM